MTTPVHPVEGSCALPPAAPSSVPSGARDLRGAAKGPVRILCDEIGFPFDRRMERPDVLVAFAAELLAVVSFEDDLERHLASLTGREHSPDSLSAIGAARAMLSASDKIGAAAEVHDLCYRLNPDDAIPTNHTIDMVSSIASVVRFGLERPCHSRHGAEAANHVWKQLYGVRRFAAHTPAWEKDWARSILTRALISLLPDAPAHGGDDGRGRDEGEAGVNQK